jgi:hypothetical protein
MHYNTVLGEYKNRDVSLDGVKKLLPHRLTDMGIPNQGTRLELAVLSSPIFAASFRASKLFIRLGHTTTR